MVMQAAADFLVGGSNPDAANTTAVPPTTDQDSNRRPKNSAGGCVTIRPRVDVTQLCLPLLGAFSAKTFDPPPPPPAPPHPPQKRVIQPAPQFGEEIPIIWQNNSPGLFFGEMLPSHQDYGPGPQNTLSLWLLCCQRHVETLIS